MAVGVVVVGVGGALGWVGGGSSGVGGAWVAGLHGRTEVELLGGGTKEQGVLGSLWSGLRELVLPSRLSPLVLESRPVVAVDRMFEGRSYRATGWAVIAH